MFVFCCRPKVVQKSKARVAGESKVDSIGWRNIGWGGFESWNTVDGSKIRLATKDEHYPMIYRVLTIPGGCLGFLPSTVAGKVWFQISSLQLTASFPLKRDRILRKECCFLSTILEMWFSGHKILLHFSATFVRSEILTFWSVHEMEAPNKTIETRFETFWDFLNTKNWGKWSNLTNIFLEIGCLKTYHLAQLYIAWMCVFF